MAARWLIGSGFALTLLGWAAAFSIAGLVFLGGGAAALLVGVALAPGRSALGWLVVVVLVGWATPVGLVSGGPLLAYAFFSAAVVLLVLMWRFGRLLP